MKKDRRIIVILSLICLFALILSACGQKTSGTETKDTTTTTESKVSQPVTLRFFWWGGEARHAQTIDAAKVYMKNNDNVSFEFEYQGYDGYFQKLITQLSSGTAPDIIQIDRPWLFDLSQQGQTFADLYKFANLIDLQSFNNEYLKKYCEDATGKLAGVPTGQSATTFIVNTEFFRDLGIDYDIDWTFEKIMEIGKQIAEKSPGKYLIGAGREQPDTHPSILNVYIQQKTGKDLVCDDYTRSFDEKLMEEAYNYYLELAENKVMLPLEISAASGGGEDGATWLGGNLGMLPIWSSTIPVSVEQCDFEVDVVSYPITPGTKNTGIAMYPAQLMSINEKSKFTEEAAKFFDWFFHSEEASLILRDCRGVPASSKARDVLVENDLLLPLAQKAIDNATKNLGSTPSMLGFNAELGTMWGDIMEQVYYKQLTPSEAAKEICTRYDEKIEEIKASAK